MKNLLRYRYTLCIGLLMWTTNALFGQEIDKTILQKKINKLFENYEYYGALTESFDANQITESYVTKFKALFGANAMVLVDVRQAPDYGKLVSVERYVEILREWYPGGLSVNIKAPTFSEYSCKKGICRTIVSAYKDLGGFTKEAKDFRDEDITLYFTITFDETMETLQIGQVAGEGEPVAVVEPKPTKPKKPEDKDVAMETPKDPKVPKEPKAPKEPKPQKVKPAKPKKPETVNVFNKSNNEKSKRLYVGLSGAVGFTGLLGGDVVGNSDALYLDDLSSVNYDGIFGSIGYQIGANAQYFWSQRVGVSAGIGLDVRNSSISGTIRAATYDVSDIHGGAESRTFSANKNDFRETYSVTYLNIPVAFNWQGFDYLRQQALRPYFSGGLAFGIKMGESTGFEGSFSSVSSYEQDGTTVDFTYFSPRNDAEKIFIDTYWLYDGTTKIVGKPVAPPSSTGIQVSPFVEGGMDFFPNRKKPLAFHLGIRASLGALALFGGDEAGNQILLKARNDKATEVSNSLYEYTPFSSEADEYEYSSLHSKEATRPVFLGLVFGIKFQKFTQKRGGLPGQFP